MNRKKLFAALIGFCLISMPMHAQGKDESMTLDVKTVEMEGFSTVRSVTTVDKKGNEVSFSGHPSGWFANATADEVTVKGNIAMRGDFSSKDFFSTAKGVLKDDGRLRCEFKVKGKVYPIGVGPGSKLVVKKGTDGKYTLLPERTAKLSPPPKKE